MAEKREFLERIRELTQYNVIQKEDRDEIYRVLLAVCDRELAKVKAKEE